MSAEQLLTILAIIVLTIVILTVIGLVMTGFIIKRKLSRINKLKFLSVGSLPALFQIFKLLKRP